MEEARNVRGRCEVRGWKQGDSPSGFRTPDIRISKAGMAPNSGYRGHSSLLQMDRQRQGRKKLGDWREMVGRLN